MPVPGVFVYLKVDTDAPQGFSAYAYAVRVSSVSCAVLWATPDKVLDTCSFTPFRWVFFAATTNVGLRVKVTDLNTGVSVTYTNIAGTAAQPVQDVRAFLCDSQ